MNPPRSPPTAGRTSRRAALLGLAVVFVLIGALLIVNLARTPLAVNLATDWLKSHGVASSIQVTALSDHALSAHVRLGAPDDPDLVIERLDMTYRLSGPWGGAHLGFTPLTLRLIRPRLRVGVRQGHLDFGGLTPLIAWLQALPPSNTPLPDMILQNGEVDVETPGGPLRFFGDAAYRGGALDFAELRLSPFQGRQGAFALRGAGGRLRLDRHGDRLAGEVDLGPLDFGSAGARGRMVGFRLNADLPYPSAAAIRTATPLVGPVQAKVSVRDLQGAMAIGTLRPTALTASFAGQMRFRLDRQDISGALTANLGILGLEVGKLAMSKGGYRADQLDLQTRWPQIALSHDATGLTASGTGAVHMALASLRTADLNLTGLSADLGVRQARLALNHQGLSLVGDVSADARGRGALSSSARRRLGLASPTAGPGAAVIQAANQALSDFTFTLPAWRGSLESGGARGTVTGVADLRAASGAHVNVTTTATVQGLGASGFSRLTGLGRLSLSGGGLPLLKVDMQSLSLTPVSLTARFAADAAVDTAQIHAGRLKLQAELVAARRGLALDLLGCASLTAKAVQIAATGVKDLSAQLCPRHGPLIEMQGPGWRADGEVRGLAGRSMDPGPGLSDAIIGFAAQGSAGGLDEALITLDQAHLVDTLRPQRIEPLSATGRLQLARGTWEGLAHVATPADINLVNVQFTEDTTTNLGRAAFDTGPLTFAAGGLQPLSLTPLATFARQAAGEVRVQGWVAWDNTGKSHSGAEVAARGLEFIAPFGPVKGLNADLHFTSLLPLISAPDQQITVAELDTVTPITRIQVRFDLGADHLKLNQARAVLANGDVSLEPLTAPFGPKTSFTGVLDVAHVDIGEILAATSLADEVKLEAKVDGRVPFTLGPRGLSVQNGSLAAIGGGRLSISPQALTGVAASKVAGAKASAPRTSFAQNIASQAMENLAFTRLDAALTSLPGDRMGIIFHIKGRHDPPQRQRALIPLMDILRGQALAKPLTLPSGTEVNLTLDTSLNFGDLITSLDTAWREALQPIRDTPALIKLTPPIASKSNVSKGTPP